MRIRGEDEEVKELGTGFGMTVTKRRGIQDENEVEELGTGFGMVVTKRWRMQDGNEVEELGTGFGREEQKRRWTQCQMVAGSMQLAGLQ